ncbi:MAG TPA: heat-inducible transcriptional repressor HrcA [Candidatus Limnocylindrales bacterium]|nr:heat-inducible transcriptional repressor HrcA [Candidatus Limnocylindrales bacterium]
MVTRASGSELPELGERQREILRAAIREFIATAEPVASGALVRRYRLSVSPATVRSELAALESLGLLTQPHTSAGRIPTDLGYRYFIESLMSQPGLGPDEQVTVSHQFRQSQRDLAEWLRLAASTLARLTRAAAIVTTPAAPRSRLRHVEAVPVGDRRAVIVCVLDGGVVRQQLVDLPEPATPASLHALSTRAIERFLGADASTVRAAVVGDRTNAAEVVGAIARSLEQQDEVRSREVYYDGIQNILAQPEFGTGERFREMLRLLEDRTQLMRLVPPGLGEGEVHVAIGSEHRLEPLRQCSLVFGRYGGTSGVIGYVGVVGPTRMDYARSIGAVRYVGVLMNDVVRVSEGH